MQETDITVMVAYINKYLLAFIVSAMGAFSNEAMMALRVKAKMNPLKVLVPSIFNAFLLCALDDYFTMSFQIYMFVCFFMGMWSFQIMKLFTNLRFVTIVIKSVFKALKDPISKGIVDAVDEIDKMKDSEERNVENDKDNKNDTG